MDDRSPIVIEDETLRTGFTVIPNAILSRADISPGAKLTYIMLLSYAWQTGSCFPGQVRLAQDIGVTPRSVITYLQQLQAAGLLIVKRKGQGMTNTYYLPRSENISLPVRSETASPPKMKRFQPKKDADHKKEKYGIDDEDPRRYTAGDLGRLVHRGLPEETDA